MDIDTENETKTTNIDNSVRNIEDYLMNYLSLRVSGFNPAFLRVSLTDTTMNKYSVKILYDDIDLLTANRVNDTDITISKITNKNFFI